MEERGAGGRWEGFSRESAQEKGRHSTKWGVWRTPAAGVVALPSPSNARTGDQQQMIWGEEDAALAPKAAQPCTCVSSLIFIQTPHTLHTKPCRLARAQRRTLRRPTGTRSCPTAAGQHRRKGRARRAWCPAWGPATQGRPSRSSARYSYMKP